MTCRRSRMASAENASNDSAQSPAWRRKASPPATRARAEVSSRASPANTRGGYPASSLPTRSSWAPSGQSGCWAAARERHDVGVHASEVAGIGLDDVVMVKRVLPHGPDGKAVL